MIIVPSKIDAIVSLVPGAAVTVLSDNTVNWIDPSKPPVTEQQIQNELNRLLSEYESKEYQRLRAPEYPSIQDQLDMQYHDAVNGTTTWQDAINAVKAKYPKPEGV